MLSINYNIINILIMFGYMPITELNYSFYVVGRDYNTSNFDLKFYKTPKDALYYSNSKYFIYIVDTTSNLYNSHFCLNNNESYTNKYTILNKLSREDMEKLQI